MEAGRVGVLGQSVPKPVKLGFKLERGNASSLRLEMEEKHAKELRENNGSVTLNRVQVRTLTLSVLNLPLNQFLVVMTLD